MNKIIITGRLTTDPELKSTQTGKSVCDFNLAVERDFTNENGNREADFIRCMIWNKSAEALCKYQIKGNKIAVVGSLRNEVYRDKDDNKRYKTYVLVSEIEFLESKKIATDEQKNSKKVAKTSGVSDEPFEEFADIELTETDEDLAF